MALSNIETYWTLDWSTTFEYFFLKGTIMKYKFIVFLHGYLKAQHRGL